MMNNGWATDADLGAKGLVVYQPAEVSISVDVVHFLAPAVCMQIDFFGTSIHSSKHYSPHVRMVVFCCGNDSLVHGTLPVGGSFYQHFPTQVFYERKVNDLFGLYG
jgi:hypothetical protein